jgi:hypothetical protein
VHRVDCPYTVLPRLTQHTGPEQCPWLWPATIVPPDSSKSLQQRLGADIYQAARSMCVWKGDSEWRCKKGFCTPLCAILCSFSIHCCVIHIIVLAAQFVGCEPPAHNLTSVSTPRQPCSSSTRKVSGLTPTAVFALDTRCACLQAPRELAPVSPSDNLRVLCCNPIGCCRPLPAISARGSAPAGAAATAADLPAVWQQLCAADVAWTANAHVAATSAAWAAPRMRAQRAPSWLALDLDGLLRNIPA